MQGTGRAVTAALRDGESLEALALDGDAEAHEAGHVKQARQCHGRITCLAGVVVSAAAAICENGLLVARSPSCTDAMPTRMTCAAVVTPVLYVRNSSGNAPLAIMLAPAGARFTIATSTSSTQNFTRSSPIATRKWCVVLVPTSVAKSSVSL